MKPRVWVSWSTGKDSAWTLHCLRQQGHWEICGLVTTYHEVWQRVAIHGVKLCWARAQAAAAQLPLIEIPLPAYCTNEQYEQRVLPVLRQAREHGIQAIAFGDLFLADVRAYREALLARVGLEPVFPLWEPEGGTHALARKMLAAGVRAIITCVDPRVLPLATTGRSYDASFIDQLPEGIDPCGEQGEFHTFCTAGPMFTREIAVTGGKCVLRDGFAFAELEAVG
ncbi:MAG: ATPase [Planctomycetaceae bacterium]|nr:MAG: ATPase [Planctomycetaceae bacterium]